LRRISVSWILGAVLGYFGLFGVVMVVFEGFGIFLGFGCGWYGWFWVGFWLFWVKSGGLKMG